MQSMYSTAPADWAKQKQNELRCVYVKSMCSVSEIHKLRYSTNLRDLSAYSTFLSGLKKAGRHTHHLFAASQSENSTVPGIFKTTEAQVGVDMSSNARLTSFVGGDKNCLSKMSAIFYNLESSKGEIFECWSKQMAKTVGQKSE